MPTVYIIWNEARTEGVVFADEDEAMATADRLPLSDAGMAFCAAHDDDELTLERVLLSDEVLAS